MTLGVLTTVAWFSFRIYVPTNKCAVLIKKTGAMLPEGESVATNDSQRGIQQEVLGPGRHFRDPFRWEWKLVDQQVIPAGDPTKWKFNTRILAHQPDAIRNVMAAMAEDLPKIGVVTRRVGKRPPPGQLVVKRSSGYQGILEEVLTPGTYKLNPNVYEVTLYPATVVPTGYVGVVTNLMNSRESSAAFEQATAAASPDAASPVAATGIAPEEEAIRPELDMHVRPLASPGQRGTLRDVLQPGIYFINPKVKKVTLVEIGFHEYSQLHTKGELSQQISFPSDTGFLITVGVTVVWGVDPSHAAEIINEFGNVDGVLDKVIAPQLRSICRNIGSTYAARDFIQGEKRELFQQDLTRELQRICRAKNIEVLLALVREIEVHAPSTAGNEDTSIMEDLKRTIQQSYIATESRITKDKQREAATVKAQLEESKKKVDIARENIKAETRVLTAGIAATGAKTAAEVDAQAALEVATIQQQVAELEAKRIAILGQAKADVEKMKNDAEAEGYKLLVEAFGSPQAYNLYTFAENFAPDSIKIFYAGEGTFWTDLSRFEELGAAKVLQANPALK
jgi:hypothetical protein